MSIEMYSVVSGQTMYILRLHFSFFIWQFVLEFWHEWKLFGGSVINICSMWRNTNQKVENALHMLILRRFRTHYMTQSHAKFVYSVRSNEHVGIERQTTKPDLKGVLDFHCTYRTCDILSYIKPFGLFSYAVKEINRINMWPHSDRQDRQRNFI